MKFLFKSDFHIDFHVKYTHDTAKLKERVKEYARNMFPETEEKLPVLLGGDYANSNIYSIPFIEEVSRLSEHVFVVFGNHDLYFDSKTQKNKYNGDSYNRILEIKEHFKDFENIAFLENFEVIEYKGLKIAGSTNWYKIQEFNEIIQFKMMNDSRLIKSYNIGTKGYEEDIAFDALNPVDIILTHVSPYRTKSNFEKGDECFLSKRDTTKARHWFAGHVHEKQNYKITDNSFLHTNANGYPGEEDCGGKFEVFEVEDVS